MFDRLFTHCAIIQKHRDGPLADVRVGHLQALIAAGYLRSTVLRHAAYALCVAVAIDGWARTRDVAPIERAELDAFATRWAARRVRRGRARATLLPRRTFLQIARALLSRIGRLSSVPVDPLRRRVDTFVEAHREQWPSPATRRSMGWQVLYFLRFLRRRGVASEQTTHDVIDAYLAEQRSRCTRGTMHVVVDALRAWFRFASSRRWTPRGLAEGIVRPRLYALEGVPCGPTPEQARQLLASVASDTPVGQRDLALLLLMTTYGLRSAEVCRLQLDDLDWARGRLHVVRVKSGRHEWLPMEPHTGAALARYLRVARPRTICRALFLTVRAPIRPLSSSGLYNVVAHRLRAVADVPRGRGPHGLRHACARRLMAAGMSFKTIGDHLGHRSPEATEIYAKVDAASLRAVVWNDPEGLIRT
jgi:site-specific recombinase XerD